ncbi:MAG TPA: hypothetical protein VGM44_22925 [Polyangiaceae bacterium]|jgi:hypothetical protein
MTDAPSPPHAVGVLSEHPKVDLLAEHVCAVALDAAAARRSDFASRFHTEPPTIGSSAELSSEDAQTPLGNVRSVLERGIENPDEQNLLGALLAMGIARALPDTPEEQQVLTANLVWLAAHTPCSALEFLDDALGDRAGAIWEAIARVARAPVLSSPDFGNTEALVAAAALCRSVSEVAHRARLHLAQNTNDPVLRALATSGDAKTELSGELSLPPLGPVVTALLGLTLVLFIARACSLIARFALAYRKPATLKIGPQGLEVSHRIELMGKILRDRSTLVPLTNLARVTREVRYARVGLYAGLIALVIGTYFGVGLIVDGVRVPGGSPPLLGMAVTCIIVGLGLDFLLSTAADSARGKCRIVIVQQTGRKLCVGSLDPTSADAMLSSIAEHAHT